MKISYFDKNVYIYSKEIRRLVITSNNNLCHTLDRCKVAYIHEKLHDFYPMQ
jgi:hypothetical protein